MNKRSFASVWQTISRKYGIYMVAVCVIILGAILSPVFLTVGNFMSVARQISITGILAFAETLIIISGCTDLSLGAQVAFAGVIGVDVYLMSGESFVLAFLASIAVACLCGLFNGIMVTKVGLAPFIATLAMDMIARGGAYLYTGGNPIYQTEGLARVSQATVFGVPVPVLFLTGVMIISAILLRTTRYGRQLFAVGGNPEAARASGISIAKTRIIAYVIASAFTGIAAVLQMARINAGMPDTANGYHGDAIAAAVVGGTAFGGGIGTALGTLIGALIIGLLNNILNLMGVQSFVQQIVRGTVILVAVGWDIQSKRRQVKKA